MSDRRPDVYTYVRHSDGSISKLPMREVGDSGKWETDETYSSQLHDVIHVLVIADGEETWIPMAGLPPLSDIL